MPVFPTDSRIASDIAGITSPNILFPQVWQPTLQVSWKIKNPLMLLHLSLSFIYFSTILIRMKTLSHSLSLFYFPHVPRHFFIPIKITKVLTKLLYNCNIKEVYSCYNERAAILKHQNFIQQNQLTVYRSTIERDRKFERGK